MGSGPSLLVTLFSSDPQHISCQPQTAHRTTQRGLQYTLCQLTLYKYSNKQQFKSVYSGIWVCVISYLAHIQGKYLVFIYKPISKKDYKRICKVFVNCLPSYHSLQHYNFAQTLHFLCTFF